MRFLHAADIHLGYQQYGSAERYNDFALAFGHMVDDALARRVDYLLLAGDLFHQRTIDPGTLLQATHHLQRLRDAGIPVIAVEGNHERPHYLEKLSWLDYLAETGLLIVLTPEYRGGAMVVERWTEQDRVGAYVDLPGGVRVIGAKYFGAATGRVLQDLHRALPDLPGDKPAYTILMLHAGLEGILDHYSATVSRAQLDVLRPYADYLALGHIHKPFAQDGWIYNPGSIETVSMTEVEWDDRGYFIVDVDPAAEPRHRVTRVRSRRRAFERHYLAVDRFDTPEELHRGLAHFLEQKATPETAAATEAGWVTSHTTALASPPCSRIELATSSKSACVRAATTTRMSCCASATAMALPIPLLAPVTNAIRFIFLIPCLYPNGSHAVTCVGSIL